MIFQILVKVGLQIEVRSNKHNLKQECFFFAEIYSKRGGNGGKFFHGITQRTYFPFLVPTSLIFFIYIYKILKQKKLLNLSFMKFNLVGIRNEQDSRERHLCPRLTLITSLISISSTTSQPNPNLSPPYPQQKDKEGSQVKKGICSLFEDNPLG